MMSMRLMLFFLFVCAGTNISIAGELPGKYFRLLEAGITQVEERLSEKPAADLQTLEAGGHSRQLFPHVILAAAVLYAKSNPSNNHYKDPKILALALKIGDLLASENERGRFEERLNSDRDVYMWLDAYRLLAPDLGEDRPKRWRREIEKNIAVLAADTEERVDFPGYQSPFIGTSPNHLSLWASTVYLGGKIFGNRPWEELGARVMHRFAAEEQSPNGYWGEHEQSLPTPGYDYTTYTGVALYQEHSHDPAALKALRRGLDFHKFFTFPDGTPVEVLDDRNRFTQVKGWGRSLSSVQDDEEVPSGGNDESVSKGQFGFSNFPDGRRYAEFLTSFFQKGRLGYEDLGRIAQNALYYHAGPSSPIPQDLPHYSRQLSLPAGIRKSSSWVVCLSGLISTQAVTNQYYHDRQGNLSIYHQKPGLIVTGANSKRQPELATFSERMFGTVFHLPLSSRLQMSAERDRLSLAYNTFFSDLYVVPHSDRELEFHFAITGRGSPGEEAKLTLQLCLKAGETLEIASGRKILLSSNRIVIDAGALGGWLRHHGWTMKVDPTASLVWPVYPHNPYGDGPEKSVQFAVGALSVPLRLKAQPGRYVRPNEQDICFLLNVD